MDESQCLKCQGEVKQLYRQINKTGYCSWDCYLGKYKVLNI